MLIQQTTVPTPVGLPQDISKKLLAEMASGQRVDVVAIKPALAAEIIAIRVADSLLSIRTPFDVQAGQKLQIELGMEQGKPVLKLIQPEQSQKANAAAVDSLSKLSPASQPIKVGQQVAVEVIKILAENRVLVQTTGLTQQPQNTRPTQTVGVTTPTAGATTPVQTAGTVIPGQTTGLTKQTQTTTVITPVPTGNVTTPVINSGVNNQLQTNIKSSIQVSTPSNLAQGIGAGASQIKQPAQQFDIDVSKLSKNYKVGDKLAMAIVSTQPLSIQLRPDKPQSREAIIRDQLRQLLPQVLSSPRLDKVLNTASSQQLPKQVQGAVQHLVTNTLDKSAITQTNALKQALATSGVFTESQLIKKPNENSQDFKTNISRVLTSLETVITQTQAQLIDKPINKLPAQVQAALLSNGKTPVQLLNVLLSGNSNTPSSLTQSVLSSITSQEQATALIQILTKSLMPQQQAAALAASRQAPMELAQLMAIFKEVEGVHNKLQHNQLSMLKEPESSNIAASWLFDVPIKDKQNVDLLQVQIDQQKKQAEIDDESWQVQLRLDTQNLGPVQASVTLQGEDVKVVIRAEQAESAQLLTEHLPLLDAKLEKLNVSVSHMSCGCGEVSKRVSNTNDYYETESSDLVNISV